MTAAMSFFKRAMQCIRAWLLKLFSGNSQPDSLKLHQAPNIHVNPPNIHVNRWDAEMLIRDVIESNPALKNSFSPLCIAHYNEQLDYLGQSNASKATFDNYRLAANYFARNRSRLLEWWCLYGDKRHVFQFLDEEDMINLEVSGFEAMIIYKMKKLGVDIDIAECLDKHHVGGCLAINENNQPNSVFMENVKSRAKLMK